MSARRLMHVNGSYFRTHIAIKSLKQTGASFNQALAVIVALAGDYYTVVR
jgi:hypothetical protein